MPSTDSPILANVPNLIELCSTCILHARNATTEAKRTLYSNEAMVNSNILVATALLHIAAAIEKLANSQHIPQPCQPTPFN